MFSLEQVGGGLVDQVGCRANIAGPEAFPHEGFHFRARGWIDESLFEGGPDLSEKDGGLRRSHGSGPPII